MADVTIANIVLQRPDSEKLASAFKEYAMQNAELVAKKELALMGIAINNAAAKGSSSIAYKPSRDFTILQGEFYNKAVEIINADLSAAEYRWDVTYKNGYAVAFTFDWTDGAEGGNGGESGQGSTTDQDEEWNDLDDGTENGDGESENGEPQE